MKEVLVILGKYLSGNNTDGILSQTTTEDGKKLYGHLDNSEWERRLLYKIVHKEVIIPAKYTVYRTPIHMKEIRQWREGTMDMCEYEVIGTVYYQ